MKKSLLLIAALFCSTNLQAIEQQWTNVKLQYNDYSYDGKSKAVLGRYEFIDNFYVMADYLEHESSYDRVRFDPTSGTNIPVHITRDYNVYGVGVGAYYDITDSFTMNVEFERSKSDDYEFFVEADEGFYLNPCPSFNECDTITSEYGRNDTKLYNSSLTVNTSWAITENLVLSAGLLNRRNDESSSNTLLYRELGLSYFFTPELGLEYIRAERNGSDFHINRFNIVYAF